MKTTFNFKGARAMSAFARGGFTLVELLVVVGMIAILLGALTTSITAAQQRARVQKATSDVKVIAQAILASENYAQGGEYKIKTMAWTDADASSLDFVLGRGGTTDSGDKIPAMLMASLSAGGKMRDPWGTPYKITVREGAIAGMNSMSSLTTGYYLPNFNRLDAEERK